MGKEITCRILRKQLKRKIGKKELTWENNLPEIFRLKFCFNQLLIFRIFLKTHKISLVFWAWFFTHQLYVVLTIIIN